MVDVCAGRIHASKPLIAAADAAHEAAGTHRFGVMVGGPVQIDDRAVMERVRRERDRFVGFVIDALDAWPADTRTCGRVHFLDDHTLEIDGGDRIEAKRMVIPTGVEDELSRRACGTRRPRRGPPARRRARLVAV